MARAPKRTPKEDKAEELKAKRKQAVVNAAALAAEEAEEELDEEIAGDGVSFQFGNDETTTQTQQEEQYASLDVFKDAFDLARSLNDSPKYYIKKNSQFLCTKDYPYDWEKLQQEFGGGYYQVIAKRRSNGHFLKQQTEDIAGPQNVAPVTKEADKKEDSSLALLALVQQFQEQAAERTRTETNKSENGIASVMQAVMAAQSNSMTMMMQMQQQSTQQFQSMMLELQKESRQTAKESNDKMLTLFTTLLTKKPSDGEGITSLKLMELVHKAEERAETRATKNFELIERKADALAEMKAEAMNAGGDGEGEESFTKTLIKGFVPVMAQMMAQKPPAAQSSALQNFEQHREGQIREQFIEDTATRPAIKAPQRPTRQPNRDGHSATSQPVNAQPRHPGTLPKVVNPNAVPATNSTTSVQNDATGSQVLILDDRQKDDIMTMIAPEIGDALMHGTLPSQASEVVLKKLEKEGHKRQTIIQSFTLVDFENFMARFTIPEEHKAPVAKWVEEFHAALVKVQVESTPTGPNTLRSAGATAKPINGQHGGVDTKSVPRGATTRPSGTRAQSRSNPSSLSK